MPQFLVPIISAIGAAVGGLTGAVMIMYAAEIAIAAVLIGGLAYSNAQKNKAQRQARDQYNASQVDRLVNVIATDAPRELVMGRVRKAGSIFYRGSTGKDSQDLYMAIALAGHEIDGIEGYYLNDEPVTIDANGYVQEVPYKVTTRTTLQSTTLPVDFVAGSLAEYTDVAGGVTYNYQADVVSYTVKITPYLGAAWQAADPSLMAAFPADWTSANIVQGVAYLVVKLSYNETAFPSGVPNVTVKLRGAKLYDPRTGLTTFSENPALMMRHVMLHPQFGKAASISAAEDARITAAANACDTATVYTVGGVAQASRALYKASIVLPFGAPAKSGLDDLAQAMGGSWAFAGGELYLKAGVYTAPVMSLTEADLAVIVRDGASETQKPIGISIHRERAQKFNSVKATIWDDAQDYKQTPLTALTSSALVTRDGAELIQEVQLPAVGYAPQALHICGVMMRDARDALTVELPFKLRAYPLELFDTVTLTIARYGWNNKQFMILGRTWMADGSISLTMKETTAAITQMDAGFLAQGFASNTNLPKPWEVQRVGTITVTSGTAELIKQADGTIVSRMRVSWPQVTDKAVQQNGKIEVQYRRADSTGAWTSLLADGADTTIASPDVQDGIHYLVRARARTSLAVGDWGNHVQHKVIGKQAVPSNVAGLTQSNGAAGITLSWTPSAEADYSSTEIRQGASWGAGTMLFSGAANNWTWARPASGSYTFWVKHFDTSGWESATATSMAVTYVLPDIDNAAAIATAAADATAKASKAVGDNLFIGDLATITGANLGGVISSTGYTDPRGTNSAVVVALPVAQSHVYWRVLNANNAQGWYTVSLKLYVVAGMSIVVSATDAASWGASEYVIATTASVTPVWVAVSFRQYCGPGSNGLDVVVGNFMGAGGPINSAPASTAVAICDLTVRKEFYQGAANATANQSDATTNNAIAAAQANAISTAAAAAQAKADLAEVTAKAYADGVVDAEEARAIADATAKANAAQSAAITASALTQIAVNQSWQVMPYSPGITYTNSTGKPIMLSVVVMHAAAYDTSSAWINGVQKTYFGVGSYPTPATHSTIVPDGATYKIITTSGSLNGGVWNQLTQ